MTRRRASAPPALALALACALASGCDGGPAEAPAGDDGAGRQLDVVTTFEPTRYFAERIGGEAIRVANLCPADADPAAWQPPGEVIARCQQADLIVLNGASFEAWPGKVSLPEAHVVDTAHPLRSELLTYAEAVKHSHGPAGQHAHEGVDGHTWLDPLQAKVQAEQILKALNARRPSHREAFEAGYQALARDLDALHARLEKIAAAHPAAPLLAAHPAYNYLARRYGWNLQSLDLDPGTEPDETQLRDLAARLAAHPARVLLWESAPLEATAARLAADHRLLSVVFSPCEQLPPGAERKTYLAIMQGNLDRLERALATH